MPFRIRDIVRRRLGASRSWINTRSRLPSDLQENDEGGDTVMSTLFEDDENLDNEIESTIYEVVVDNDYAVLMNPNSGEESFELVSAVTEDEALMRVEETAVRGRDDDDASPPLPSMKIEIMTDIESTKENEKVIEIDQRDTIETKRLRFSSTTNRNRHAANIRTQTTEERPSILGLYAHGDDNKFTRYECLIRKQLEFYEPSQPSKAILESCLRLDDNFTAFVGIRCRHCAHHYRLVRGIDQRQIGGEDTVWTSFAAYPIRTTELAKTAHTLAMQHLVRCKYVSSVIRHEILRLARQLHGKDHDGTGPLPFREEYWYESAMSCGIQSTLKWIDFHPSAFLQWKADLKNNPAHDAGTDEQRQRLSREYYNFHVGDYPRGLQHLAKKRETFFVDQYRRRCGQVRPPTAVC